MEDTLFINTNDIKCNWLFNHPKQIVVNKECVDINTNKPIKSDGPIFNSILSKKPNIEKELKNYCFLLLPYQLYFAETIVQDFLKKVEFEINEKELKDIYNEIILEKSDIIKFNI